MESNQELTVTKEEVMEVLQSDDYALGTKMHILKQYHYEQQGYLISDGLAVTLIQSVTEMQHITAEKLVLACSGGTGTTM